MLEACFRSLLPWAFGVSGKAVLVTHMLGSLSPVSGTQLEFGFPDLA